MADSKHDGVEARPSGGQADPLRQIFDLELLLDVARQLGSTVELDPLLAAIATAAISVLDCERATVFLYDAATNELYSRLATGMGDSKVKEIRFPVGQGIAGEVASSGCIINLPDAYADPRFNREFDRRSGFHTSNMLAFPLAGLEKATVGVLQVLNKRGGPFNDRDEHMVGFLGAQAGVALQRQMLLGHFAEKQRIQRDLNIARDIQQGLLPREKPAIAGYDIAGWNRPADETGGDYYDYLPLADGSLALTLADVTGHGIGPALIVAETRALFRATVLQRPDLPHAVDQVNMLLSQDLPEGKFVTAFFGILSPSAHSIRFLSAGQGPILAFAAASGAVADLETHGLPLGVMPDADYSSTSDLVFEPGDMLVLFTDGFYEWDRPDGEAFGMGRVADLLRRHHALPAAELIQVVYKAVVDFSEGTRQADDLTAVIVKRLEG